MSANSRIKIFSGNSNPLLANKICKYLNVELGKANIGAFSDGETQITIDESVRGADVYVVQSTSRPVNKHLMELLIMVDALRRASARRITVVIPYYGYARQDRKARARDPITAKLVANLIYSAGARRVLTMDLHATQIEGFFDIPVDHLLGVPILADYYIDKNIEDLVVVAPDMGGVRRARNLAKRIGAPLAIIDKRRPMANVSEVVNLIGDVEGKNVIMVDDIIDTAGTITNGAKSLMERGAKKVYACCTHPVLSGPAIERIKEAPIVELVTTDCIPIGEDKMLDKIKVLSVSQLMGEAIMRIHDDMSVSKLFD